MLTTGASSGLGKYLHESLGGSAMTRETSAEELVRLTRDGCDVVIHAAFNPAKSVDSRSFFGYINDNLLLTAKLTSVPHGKFIFISSVDVYPQNGMVHTEDEVINPDSIRTMYGLTKLMSESVVRETCTNHLILRPSALLGKYSRPNSLIRIFEERGCTLSVSGDSRFNYVLYSDILDFIRIAMREDLKGTYNLVSAGSISAADAAALVGNMVNFGTYRYDAGEISNLKAAAVSSSFSKTTLDVINEFMGERV